MTLVKICGITRAEDAVVAAELGADFLGFVFHEKSPRAIAPDRAKAIVDTVRHRGPASPRFVGVFVDERPERVRAIVQQCGLDVVQFHGSESSDEVAAIGMTAIKALRVGTSVPESDAYECEWLLFDSLVDGVAGGSGRSFGWELLERSRPARPFFLAGGLTPANVGAAVRQVRPAAIDLSSGVEESPGIKDHAKLRDLFRVLAEMETR
jgi:phosphoribosylanthranilate isomerase